MSDSEHVNGPLDREVRHLRARVAELEGLVAEGERTEQALRDSEERCRTQYYHIPLPTYTWQKIEVDFRLLAYNKAAEILTKGGLNR